MRKFLFATLALLGIATGAAAFVCPVHAVPNSATSGAAYHGEGGDGGASN